MKTVSEYIKEAYKNWKEGSEMKGGSEIFISAPTGSGKTYFVLNIFLPYFYEQKKKILFLVNRRILKEQIETEIQRHVNFEMKDNIRVQSYQEIENSFRTIGKNKIRDISENIWDVEVELGMKYLAYLQEFNCVVCDECHYFLADSNFNTNTIISFRVIMNYFKRKIKIFMSATCEDFFNYITEKKEKNKQELNKTKIYNLLSNSIALGGISQGKIFQYSMDADYSYLDIDVLDSKASIIDLVKESSEKWLIFVDDINLGQKLRRDLMDNMKDDEHLGSRIVMLTSSYEKNDESLTEVCEVVENNKFTAKIIISTSVMDNGINIKDIELRNMIIIADNRVEFMQMLGRKRKDDKKFKLYILKQNKEHFIRRTQQTQRLLDIAKEYFVDFKKRIQEPLAKDTAEHFSWYEQYENVMVNTKHIHLMHDIVNGKLRYEEVKKLFLVFNGILYLNCLSERNLQNLNRFYNKLLDRFDEEGDDVFIREQLEWLGKTSAEIDEIIKNSSTSTLEKYKADVIDKMNQVVGCEMSTQENIAFKKTIKDKLLYIIDKMGKTNSDYQKVHDALYKPDRPLSSKNMDFLHDFCELPFSMEVNKQGKGKESTYTIRNSDMNN